MKKEFEIEREMIFAEANGQKLRYLILWIKYRIIKLGGNKMMERFKSPVFWTELVLLIASALKLFGVYEMPNDMINGIQDIITIGFSIFATLNNPTDRLNF